MPKVYDRAYFEKWYRHPRHAVGSKQELARKVALAVAVAEYYLGRPVDSVLDVGCGEAPWRAPLLALRPASITAGSTRASTSSAATASAAISASRASAILRACGSTGALT